MYGYSVWLVPLNRRLLTKVYKFRHIPHITISTNHEDLPDPINLGKLYDIVDFKPYGIIGKQYAFDPLHATGWECTVEDLFIQHTPHMSHVYSFYPHEKVLPVYPTPQRLIAEVCVADTRSSNWEEWKIIKEKLPR